MSVTLSPAYGRDYKSRKAVREDWRADKDFIIEQIHGSPGNGHTVANRSDLQDTHGPINIRFHKMQRMEMMRP